jgi:RIO kinase 3
MKMRRFDIPCPDVVALKKHILIMSFIGHESVPAPKLLDANLDKAQLQSAYDQCIQIIKDLYHKCNLVHADFNQFNCLWHEERVWVVDVSQSVEPIHPMGLEFLLRDCTNVAKYFTNRKLESVLTGEELFTEVTGLRFNGSGQVFLSQIHKYIKDKRVELNLAANHEDTYLFNFDYFFEKTNKKDKKAGEKDEDSSDEEEDEETGQTAKERANN